MKNIFYIVCTGILTGIFAFAGLISVVEAETRFSESTIVIDRDTYWGVVGSPYIIESDVFINQGVTLTIGPGVEVYEIDSSRSKAVILSGGKLIIHGTSEQRSTIHGFDSIDARDAASVEIEYTDIHDMTKGLYLQDSRAVIASSTIRNAEYGIDTGLSSLVMWGSAISSTTVGISIRGPQVFPMLMRGAVNAVSTNTASSQTLINVTGSSITGNYEAAVDNGDGASVQMLGNWWGSPDGPGKTAGDSIYGNVEYQPWLTEDPFKKKEVTCCSSVLFIPGLEASSLYRTETGVFGKNENQLWEPNRNADMKKLFLNTNGSSTDMSIYVGGPIDRAFGVKDVYGSFMKYLDGLQDAGTIGEWKSYGYDWRKPIVEVVAGSEKRSTSTDTLIGTLTTLAERSKTGKVSIIAHSNGGLVAKYLIKTLVDMGKENLVDSVISVAVPYLGTPQAILGLLHGDSQSIAGGLIVKQSVARELGINMPSAYSLLPSKEYFSKVFGPSIAFAATTTVGINNGAYPRSIDSYTGQKSFILDQKNTRNTNTSSKISLPIEGNALLANAAEILHGILDPFTWPATIARWAIVGWGNTTAKGIEYSEETKCYNSAGGSKGVTCATFPNYSATTTSLGDGTVVAPSAAYNAGSIVAVDLATQKSIDHKVIDHVNILEASTMKSAIGDILSANPAENNTKLIEKLSKLPGVTIGEPDYSMEKTFLVVSTHSPVDLHIYDKDGNHTGITPPPTGLKFSGDDQGLDEDLYTFYDEGVPGSSFEMHEGYDGNETSIVLHDDHAENYSVVIDGVGIGTFDYTIERIRGSQILDRIEYIGQPVNPLTVATGTVMTSGDLGSSGGSNTGMNVKPLASSTNLTIDVDGNGSPDIISRPGIQLDFVTYLEALKKTVIELMGNSKKATDIVKRIDRLEELAKKGKIERVRDNVEKLKRRIVHKKSKLLTGAEKDQIISMIDLFIAQFEK